MNRIPDELTDQKLIAFFEWVRQWDDFKLLPIFIEQIRKSKQLDSLFDFITRYRHGSFQSQQKLGDAVYQLLKKPLVLVVFRKCVAKVFPNVAVTGLKARDELDLLMGDYLYRRAVKLRKFIQYLQQAIVHCKNNKEEDARACGRQALMVMHNQKLENLMQEDSSLIDKSALLQAVETLNAAIEGNYLELLRAGKENYNSFHCRLEWHFTQRMLMSAVAEHSELLDAMAYKIKMEPIFASLLENAKQSIQMDNAAGYFLLYDCHLCGASFFNILSDKFSENKDMPAAMSFHKQAQAHHLAAVQQLFLFARNQESSTEELKYASRGRGIENVGLFPASIHRLTDLLNYHEKIFINQQASYAFYTALDTTTKSLGN